MFAYNGIIVPHIAALFVRMHIFVLQFEHSEHKHNCEHNSTDMVTTVCVRCMQTLFGIICKINAYFVFVCVLEYCNVSFNYKGQGINRSVDNLNLTREERNNKNKITQKQLKKMFAKFKIREFCINLPRLTISGMISLQRMHNVYVFLRSHIFSC